MGVEPIQLRGQEMFWFMFFVCNLIFIVGETNKCPKSELNPMPPYMGCKGLDPIQP